MLNGWKIFCNYFLNVLGYKICETERKINRQILKIWDTGTVGNKAESGVIVTCVLVIDTPLSLTWTLDTTRIVFCFTNFTRDSSKIAKCRVTIISKAPKIPHTLPGDKNWPHSGIQEPGGTEGRVKCLADINVCWLSDCFEWVRDADDVIVTCSCHRSHLPRHTSHILAVLRDRPSLARCERYYYITHKCQPLTYWVRL